MAKKKTDTIEQQFKVDVFYARMNRDKLSRSIDLMEEAMTALKNGEVQEAAMLATIAESLSSGSWGNLADMIRERAGVDEVTM